MTNREDLYLKKLNDSSVVTPQPVTQREKILSELAGVNGLGVELPTVTASDNGKALVVDNGQWALGNASGGSSGGGVFVVGMTSPDETTDALDKTWQEIRDAMIQSKFCYVNMYGSQQMLITNVATGANDTYTVTIMKPNNGGFSTISFKTSTANGYPTYNYET